MFFVILDEDSIKENEDKILSLIGEVKELLREVQQRILRLIIKTTKKAWN